MPCVVKLICSLISEICAFFNIFVLQLPTIKQSKFLLKITPIQSTLARGLVRPNNELNAHLDPREKERLLNEQVT